MALRIPTTQEVTDRNLSNLETALNQTSPLTEKAFLRVLAAMEALNYTELNRFAAERAKQNLAITANEDGLTILGAEYGVTRKPAVAAQLDIQAPSDPGKSVPGGSKFTGDSNSEKYTSNATGSEAGGVIDITVTADTPGIAGNLVAADTLTMDVPIVGVSNTWTVQDVAVLGTEQETIESWRRRILLEIQTVGGGGNGVDYRTWAEETAGCFRAFPYSGAPVVTVAGFLDGDMEETGVSDWTAGNSATLTKQTTSPYEGSRNLRIAYNAVNSPYAEQDFMTVGKEYRITGVGRGDGTFQPELRDGLGVIIWLGTASTTWQPFDVTFGPTDTKLFLYSNCTAAGFVEFDDIDIIQTSYPGDRSVFVEADSTIDPDGIAPPALLTAVRASINTDPDTGKARPPLGMTDENLYVVSISRTTLNVEIRDLTVDAGIEAQVKADITTAVDEYLRGVAPFIEGVDPPASQNDLITDLTLSQVIQDVLNPVGGSASGVGLYIVASTFIPSYILGQGELAKLGVVTYV
jgi:hypothetical protein